MWWSTDKLTVASAQSILFIFLISFDLLGDRTHIYYSFSIPYKIEFCIDKLAHVSIEFSPLYITQTLYIRKLKIHVAFDRQIGHGFAQSIFHQTLS